MAVDEQRFGEARKQAFQRFWKRGSDEFGLQPSPAARSGNPYGSNIVGIGRGPREKGGKLDPADRSDCIRFYVSSKAARGVLDSKHESFIPAEVNGVPTDVIEVGRVRSFSSHVSPGALVTLPNNSEVAPSDFGALGALVRETGTGSLALITCNHVIAWNERVPPGSQIHIASQNQLVSDDPAAIATFVKCVRLEHGRDNRADCAYATFDKDCAWRQSFGKLDPVMGEVGDPAIGNKVVRMGGGEAGFISDTSVTIEVDYEFGTYRLVDQIVIRAEQGKRFATEGDSGSIVMRDDGHARVPIAMVWGGRRNLTYACPLKPCLEQLGLTWVAPSTLS
jgi:hypothetical protein